MPTAPGRAAGTQSSAESRGEREGRVSGGLRPGSRHRLLSLPAAVRGSLVQNRKVGVAPQPLGALPWSHSSRRTSFCSEYHSEQNQNTRPRGRAARQELGELVPENGLWE